MQKHWFGWSAVGALVVGAITVYAAGSKRTAEECLEQEERARKNCFDELNTRRGNGGIYTCTDSTYTSRAADVDAVCGSYPSCEAWSKDSHIVNCTDVEDAMKAADKCIVAVERIDSDCLPRLSVRRENQFSRAKTAHDRCKEVLAYKSVNKLCK